MTGPLLQTRGLSKSFGGLHVTRHISLSLQAGARVGLIGPNGAGKTTLVNLMTGVLAPSAGSVWFTSSRPTIRASWPTRPQWRGAKSPSAPAA